MRIVGGSHKGRALQALGSRRLRPTADRTRESIFNILVHGKGLPLVGAAVLDLFAGTGALGLEALSRGAGHVTFVENDRASLDCVRQNAEALQMTADISIERADATKYRPTTVPDDGYQLAFLDPPYRMGLVIPALGNLASRELLAPGAAVVVETGDREELPDVSRYERLDERRYGAARIIFLRYSGNIEPG